MADPSVRRQLLGALKGPGRGPSKLRQQNSVAQRSRPAASPNGPSTFPGFVPEYIRPLFARAKGAVPGWGRRSQAIPGRTFRVKTDDDASKMFPHKQTGRPSACAGIHSRARARRVSRGMAGRGSCLARPTAERARFGPPHSNESWARTMSLGRRVKGPDFVIGPATILDAGSGSPRPKPRDRSHDRRPATRRIADWGRLWKRGVLNAFQRANPWGWSVHMGRGHRLFGTSLARRHGGSWPGRAPSDAGRKNSETAYCALGQCDL